MAMGDEMTEGSISCQFNQSWDLLSEDFAWADSCLIKDPEISYTNWNPLKDALLEIQNSQPHSFDNSSSRRDRLRYKIDTQILPSNEEPITSPSLTRRIDDIFVSNEEAEMEIDNDILSSRTNRVDKGLLGLQTKQALLPNYNGDLEGTENTDSSLDLWFSGVVMEQSMDDIFRVWDLDLPAEEDGVIKVLNEAFAESSLQPLPSTSDVFRMQKDSEEN